MSVKQQVLPSSSSSSTPPSSTSASSPSLSSSAASTTISIPYFPPSSSSSTATSNSNSNFYYHQHRRRSPRPRKSLVLIFISSCFILSFVTGIFFLQNLEDEKYYHRSSSSNYYNSLLGKVFKAVGLDKSLPIQGGHGSTVYTDDGSSFIYQNLLGGTWALDGSARAQADTPSLLEPWDYNKNRIAGVNLGGWLVTEPLITPGLFEPFYDKDGNHDPPVDEYDLSIRLGDQLAVYMTNHYATFITEQDFAQIASAGLSWVRIPVPFWMIETWPGEPHLHGVSFDYLLRSISWARKYGLRILLDLHAVPGSQNGWNHSGRSGAIGWMSGINGIVNAERSLNYLATLAYFIADPGSLNYHFPINNNNNDNRLIDSSHKATVSDIIPALAIINEPRQALLGEFPLRTFYYQAYNRIRSAYPHAPERTPIIVLFDGFFKRWKGYMTGADRIGMDVHLYQAFGSGANTATVAEQIERSCVASATRVNRSAVNFGLTFVGEWSLAMNDCGDFINGVGIGSRYEGSFREPVLANTHGNDDNNNNDSNINNDDPLPTTPIRDCSFWTDAYKWDDKTRANFRDLFNAGSDAANDWFFWTWKTGNSSYTNHPANPMWNYKLGFELGYIEPDARTSLGSCRDLSKKYHFKYQSSMPRPRAYRKEQISYVPTAKPSKEQSSLYGTWPPKYLRGPSPVKDTAPIPRLTPTGSPILLRSYPDSLNYPPPPPQQQDVKPAPHPVPIDQVSPTLSHQLGEIIRPTDSPFSFGWYTPMEGCKYLGPYDSIGPDDPIRPCQDESEILNFDVDDDYDEFALNDKVKT